MLMTWHAVCFIRDSPSSTGFYANSTPASVWRAVKLVRSVARRPPELRPPSHFSHDFFKEFDR